MDWPASWKNDLTAVFWKPIRRTILESISPDLSMSGILAGHPRRTAITSTILITCYFKNFKEVTVGYNKVGWHPLIPIERSQKYGLSFTRSATAFVYRGFNCNSDIRSLSSLMGPILTYPNDPAYLFEKVPKAPSIRISLTFPFKQVNPVNDRLN